MSLVSTKQRIDTRSTSYAIAAGAHVDHRRVLAWLRGIAPLPRGSAGERILLAAAALGVDVPVPPSAAAPGSGGDTVKTEE